MTPEETPNKGERTRKAILEAAYQLFLDQGYSATSMRQIAEQAGIAPGGIYNHFSGKDDIFVELILAKHPYVTIIPLLGDVRGGSAEEFFSNATSIIQKEIGQRPEFLKLMFIEMVEFNGRHFARVQEKIFPHFLPIFEHFQKNSAELRPITPEKFFRLFIGNIIAYYITSLIWSDPSISVDIRTVQLVDFMDVFMHGILQKEKQPQP